MSTTINFPPFRLDLRAGELYRDGSPVRLRPKTFAVLQHLAEHAGELVTKQALLDAVWGDVAVSEDVARLIGRRAAGSAGDERAAPRFIETVPRRGYRFIATVGAARRRLDIAGRRPASRLRTAASSAGRARERSRDRRVASRGDERPATDRLHHRRSRDRQDDAGRHGARAICVAPPGARCARRARTVHRALRWRRALPAGAGGAGHTAPRPRRAAVEASLRDARARLAPARDGSSRRAGRSRRGTPASTHEHTLHRLAASLEALATEMPAGARARGHPVERLLDPRSPRPSSPIAASRRDCSYSARCGRPMRSSASTRSRASSASSCARDFATRSCSAGCRRRTSPTTSRRVSPAPTCPRT